MATGPELTIIFIGISLEFNHGVGFHRAMYFFHNKTQQYLAFSYFLITNKHLL